MKIGRTIIKGLERTSDPEIILSFLRKVKENTNLSFPKLIEFRKMVYGGRGWNKKVTIKKDLDIKNIMYVLLHELTHASGYLHHKKTFWNKLFNACVKINFNPESLIRYAYGKKRWSIYKNKLKAKIRGSVS
jgi:hypothetical protein